LFSSKKSMSSNEETKKHLLAVIRGGSWHNISEQANL